MNESKLIDIILRELSNRDKNALIAILISKLNFKFNDQSILLLLKEEQKVNPKLLETLFSLVFR